jgi:hypothetical protein
MNTTQRNPADVKAGLVVVLGVLAIILWACYTECVGKQLMLSETTVWAMKPIGCIGLTVGTMLLFLKCCKK